MFTATQLVVHAVGDYIIQSDWMANNKTKSHWPCFVHALLYTLAFVLLTQSAQALLVIGLTHFLIDRWRVARFVIALRNVILSPSPTVLDIDITTGSPKSCPPFLAVWLLIIVDNIMHVCINALCLKYL